MGKKQSSVADSIRSAAKDLHNVGLIDDAEMREFEQQAVYEWGCDHCRNDGKLTAFSTCPFCDAQFDES